MASPARSRRLSDPGWDRGEQKVQDMFAVFWGNPWAIILNN